MIADPETPDEPDPGQTPDARTLNRRRFYGPGFGERSLTRIVVDYDEGIVWTMFGVD